MRTTNVCPSSDPIGQPACRAVPEELAGFWAARARSDGASRHRACFGRSVSSASSGVFFPSDRASHTASGASSSIPRAPRALKFRGVVRGRPRPARAPHLVKGAGLPGQRRLRSSARDPWRGLVPVSSATVASISRVPCGTLAPESRHEVASRQLALLLSSRPVALAIEQPVFSRRCSPAPLECEAL